MKAVQNGSLFHMYAQTQFCTDWSNTHQLVCVVDVLLSEPNMFWCCCNAVEQVVAVCLYHLLSVVPLIEFDLFIFHCETQSIVAHMYLHPGDSTPVHSFESLSYLPILSRPNLFFDHQEYLFFYFSYIRFFFSWDLDTLFKKIKLFFKR